MLERTRQKCRSLRDRWYPREIRPRVIYERVLSEASSPNSVFVEIGCGRSANTLRHLAGAYRLSIGLDAEPPGKLQLEQACCFVNADVHQIPLKSGSVDVLAMANVVEHLRDPRGVFHECARVLRPGGRLLVLTPNKWFPPILVGRLFPHRLRQILNYVASGTQEEDTFPAYYRANTPKSLATTAKSVGLSVSHLSYLGMHPNYLMFSVMLYRLGVVLERVTRRFDALGPLRNSVLGVFVKEDGATQDATTIR